MKKVRVAVAGANGYAGMTAVALLARHPGVELAQLTSRSQAGRPWSEVFPLLERSGTFAEAPDAAAVDAVFACLPHNLGAARAGDWLDAGARVIDMSADFRLRDPELYPRWYRQEHPARDLLGAAVLGLPELHADRIADARLIAVPGCYSTCAILSLAPAVAAGAIASDIVVDAKSGVSGAGRSPGLGNHFSEVNESMHAYALDGHRHLAELQQELGDLAGGTPPRITFVPHLAPMTRGILATCYFDATLPRDRLLEVYREFYAGEPFVRVLETPPSTKLASHSNLFLVSVAEQGGKTIVTGALDNLVKGASGQGVECFNIAFGFERTEALSAPVSWP